jgi:SulP family sulfate permease
LLSAIQSHLSNVLRIDIAGARMLSRLHTELSAMGIALHLVDAHGSVRDMLRGLGLEARVGSLTRRRGLAEAVDEAPSAK